MRIENVNAVNMGMKPGMAQGVDAEAKCIQQQIRDKQQEITDLNMQLRQHQIEQRKEQQSKGTSMDDILDGSRQTSAKANHKQNLELSQAGMNALIVADSTMEQAKMQGNAAQQMKDRAGVLKAEIKQDAGLGGNTQRKQEELAVVEKKAEDVTAAQMNSLGKANKSVKEATEAERGNQAEDRKTKERDARYSVVTHASL